ncbi:hypothetical protein JCM8097_000838 [Rhodosporidiobolus ruineniae]
MPVDILVAGATGFTGQLVCKYLASEATKQSFRFGVCARNADKLIKTMEDIGVEPHETFIADATDEEALRKAVKQTKVVISLVGPYMKHGHPLAKVVAEEGVHYVDLTGETAFVVESMKRNSQAAQNNECLVLHGCGFDSIPSDLCTFLAVQHLKKLGEGVQAGDVRSLFSGKGGISGGTFASGMGMAEDVAHQKVSRDPYALSPVRGSHSPSPVIAEPVTFNGKRTWGAFWFMGPYNTQIVRRSWGLLEAANPSSRLLSYGPGFRYEELMKTRGPISAALTSVTLFVVFGALAFLSPVRWLARKFGPKPGDGPSKSEQEAGWFQVETVAKSEDGKYETKATMKGKGDPGYLATSVMISSCALTLLEDYDRLPPLAKQGGHLTPATALGEMLVERLEKTGRFSFAVEEGGEGRKKSLGDLPAELKARIVELCAKQDERFKEWVKSRPSVEAELKQKQAWHGRSVSAFFRVSKEFSTLAAPYLFRVLKASKFDLRLKCADPTLRHLLFRELNLDSAELGKLTDIVAILPQLVGVNKLAISDKALRKLWGRETVTLNELSLAVLTAQYSAAMFKRLSKLEEIVTADVTPPKLLPFVLNSGATLRILDLVFDVTGLDVQSLALVLSPISLDKLDIKFTGDHGPSMSLDLARLQPYLSTPPPVKTLVFSSGFFHASLFDFCATFSSTLETLSVSSTSLGPLETGTYSAPRLASQLFPHVKDFSLSDYSYSLDTLQSIRPQHFPALVKLTFDVLDEEEWTVVDYPLSSLNLPAFSQLTTLSIPDYDGLPADVMDAIDEFCDSNNLRLEQRVSATTAAGTPPAEELGYVSSTARSLRTTLAYVHAEVDRAEAANDAATLNRLRAALERLEMERVASAAWERA